MSKFYINLKTVILRLKDEKMASRVSVYTRRITPECANMGKSISTSGIILVLISVVLVIMLIISTVYTYYKKPEVTTTATDDDGTTPTDAKTKTSGILQIIATVIGVITLLVGIWHYVIGNNLVKCINESPSS